jgi:hypothetical protein
MKIILHKNDGICEVLDQDGGINIVRRRDDGIPKSERVLRYQLRMMSDQARKPF